MNDGISGLLPRRIFRVVFALTIIVMLAGCTGKEEETESIEEYPAQEDQQRFYEKRIQDIKAALYGDPENFQLLSALGDAYFETQRYEDALKEYEKALKVAPEDTNTLNNAGLTYFYTGNSEKALDAVNRAIEIDPKYKNSWLSKGFILMSTGKYSEAVIPLKKVKELDPGGVLGEEADRFLKQIDAAKGLG